MSLFDEKRQSSDRRMQDDGPPFGSRERRSKKDRRQTFISEISFHEWTRYLLKFKKRAAAKATARQASEAAKLAARKAAASFSNGGNAPPLPVLTSSPHASLPQTEEARSAHPSHSLPMGGSIPQGREKTGGGSSG